MLVADPKQRRFVEVWFRAVPPRHISDWLSDLEPEEYRIKDSGVLAREVGHTAEGLTWLVRELIRPYEFDGGLVMRPGDGDLIIVPGSTIALRLLIYPEYPEMFGRQVLAFGNNRYAILLGAFLRNGPLHPCHRPLHADRPANAVRQPRADEFGYPE